MSTDIWYELGVIHSDGSTETIQRLEDRTFAVKIFITYCLSVSGQRYFVDEWESDNGVTRKTSDFDIRFWALDTFLMEMPIYLQEDRELILDNVEFYEP